MEENNSYSTEEIVKIINLDLNVDLKKHILRQISNLKELTYNNQNMLQIACKKHYNAEIVYWFIKEIGFQVNSSTNNNPFEIASNLNSISLIAALLSDGVPKEIMDFKQPYNHQYRCNDDYECEMRLSTQNLNDQLPISTKVQCLRDIPDHYYFFAKKSIEVVQVAMSNYHTLFLTSEGEVYSVGNGQQGTLGHGNNHSLQTPVMIEGFTDKIKVIKCNDKCSVFLGREGKLFACGTNTYHQMNFQIGMVNAPIQVVKYYKHLDIGVTKYWNITLNKNLRPYCNDTFIHMTGLCGKVINEYANNVDSRLTFQVFEKRYLHPRCKYVKITVRPGMHYGNCSDTAIWFTDDSMKFFVFISGISYRFNSENVMLTSVLDETLNHVNISKAKSFYNVFVPSRHQHLISSFPENYDTENIDIVMRRKYNTVGLALVKHAYKFHLFVKHSCEITCCKLADNMDIFICLDKHGHIFVVDDFYNLMVSRLLGGKHLPIIELQEHQIRGVSMCKSFSCDPNMSSLILFCEPFRKPYKCNYLKMLGKLNIAIKEVEEINILKLYVKINGLFIRKETNDTCFMVYSDKILNLLPYSDSSVFNFTFICENDEEIEFNLSIFLKYSEYFNCFLSRWSNNMERRYLRTIFSYSTIKALIEYVGTSITHNASMNRQNNMIDGNSMYNMDANIDVLIALDYYGCEEHSLNLYREICQNVRSHTIFSTYAKLYNHNLIFDDSLVITIILNFSDLMYTKYFQEIKDFDVMNSILVSLKFFDEKLCNYVKPLYADIVDEKKLNRTIRDQFNLDLKLAPMSDSPMSVDASSRSPSQHSDMVMDYCSGDDVGKGKSKGERKGDGEGDGEGDGKGERKGDGEGDGNSKPVVPPVADEEMRSIGDPAIAKKSMYDSQPGPSGTQARCADGPSANQESGYRRIPSRAVLEFNNAARKLAVAGPSSSTLYGSAANLDSDQDDNNGSASGKKKKRSFGSKMSQSQRKKNLRMSLGGDDTDEELIMANKNAISPWKILDTEVASFENVQKEQFIKDDLLSSRPTNHSSRQMVGINIRNRTNDLQANGRPSNGRPANGGQANGWPANGGLANGWQANGWLANVGQAIVGPANGGQANCRPANGGPANRPSFSFNANYQRNNDSTRRGFPSLYSARAGLFDEPSYRPPRDNNKFKNLDGFKDTSRPSENGNEVSWGSLNLESKMKRFIEIQREQLVTKPPKPLNQLADIMTEQKFNDWFDKESESVQKQLSEAEKGGKSGGEKGGEDGNGGKGGNGGKVGKGGEVGKGGKGGEVGKGGKGGEDGKEGKGGEEGKGDKGGKGGKGGEGGKNEKKSKAFGRYKDLKK